MINNAQTPDEGDEGWMVRNFLAPNSLAGQPLSAKSVGRLLRPHLDNPVRSGERTLVLEAARDRTDTLIYGVRILPAT
jgi:hypothetical protein